MSQNMLLMHQNTPVVAINIDEAQYDILRGDLLPYQLKGKFKRMLDFTEIHSKYDLTQNNIAMQKNYEAITDYAASRVLPITRDNAKKIYALFGYEQRQDQYSKAKIAFLCKAVSLQDDYWFKTENDSVQWENVNIRHNSLSEIVAQVSLAGSSLTLQGEVCTPELNGQGAYAKAWKREPDGLYLHKTGAKLDGINRNYESQIEVTVSHLLDKCNVPHVKYELSELYGVPTCKCKCLTDDHTSILPGMDFISYCHVNGLDANQEIMKIDADNVYKMWIVDYLISNRDRHGMNWGFYYDTNTLEIQGCHPLFDHNNAFDRALMQDAHARYLYDSSMTMRQAAHIAMEHVDFHFIDTITRDDFMNDMQFQSFTSRARELGITLTREPSQTLESQINAWLSEQIHKYTIISQQDNKISQDLSTMYQETIQLMHTLVHTPQKQHQHLLQQMALLSNPVLKQFIHDYNLYTAQTPTQNQIQQHESDIR